MTTLADEATTTQREAAAPARLHDKLTWPLTVAMIAAAIVVILGFLGGWAPAAISACSPVARQNIVIGESRFAEGKLDAADDLAEEALAVSPQCHCAHLLMAKIGLARMLAARAAGDHKAERDDRLASDCGHRGSVLCDWRGRHWSGARLIGVPRTLFS